MTYTTRKKIIPRYESKTFVGQVVLIDKILPSGAKIQVKDIKYLHPQYRQWEIDKFAVNDVILDKCTNKKRTRTLEQNRYMHLYFSLIAMAWGHGVDTDDIKNWAKGKFMAKGISEIYGDKVRKVKSTAKLTVLEMIEFLARVEVHTTIPMPDPTPFNLGITNEDFARLKAEEVRKYKAMKPNLND